MLVLDAHLRPKASGIAQALRRSGRSVDIILEDKKMKWAFKVTGHQLTGLPAG